MIKCITFDLDDTLWAVDPVITHANNTLYGWLDEHAPNLPGSTPSVTFLPCASKCWKPILKPPTA
ncbi:hypothetical protein [Aliamphritea spongicola]|nr:hypothetical protein [Aliamphritea spongicola]